MEWIKSNEEQVVSQWRPLVGYVDSYPWNAWEEINFDIHLKYHKQ